MLVIYYVFFMLLITYNLEVYENEKILGWVYYCYSDNDYYEP